MEAFRHQNVKKLISHQKYLFWSITISKCGIAIHPVNRQHQDFNMESKSNQKYAILNWSINHISRKLNLIYDIDFVVQHIKAEGGWIAISYANCTFVLTNKQPFLKLPSTGMRWDVGIWGENSKTGQQVSSFVSGLSKQMSAFLFLASFGAGILLLSTSYNVNKYVYPLLVV